MVLVPAFTLDPLTPVPDEGVTPLILIPVLAVFGTTFVKLVVLPVMPHGDTVPLNDDLCPPVIEVSIVRDTLVNTVLLYAVVALPGLL